MPLTMCVNALIDEAVDPNVRPRSNIEYGLIEETQICASLDVGIHQIDDRRPNQRRPVRLRPVPGIPRSSTRSVSPVPSVVHRFRPRAPAPWSPIAPSPSLHSSGVPPGLLTPKKQRVVAKKYRPSALNERSSSAHAASSCGSTVSRSARKSRMNSTKP